MKGLPREAACSSPFAVTDYSTHKDFGGDEALQRLKERCHKHGLRLMVRYSSNCNPPWRAKAFSPSTATRTDPSMLQRGAY